MMIVGIIFIITAIIPTPAELATHNRNPTFYKIMGIFFFMGIVLMFTGRFTETGKTYSKIGLTTDNNAFVISKLLCKERAYNPDDCSTVEKVKLEESQVIANYALLKEMSMGTTLIVRE